MNPEDEAAHPQKCEVDDNMIVQCFDAALETGRLAKTRAMLPGLSAEDCFDEITAGLASDAATKAEVFGVFARKAASTGGLRAADQRDRDASVITELLLARKPQLPGIDIFSKGVDREGLRSPSRQARTASPEAT